MGPGFGSGGEGVGTVVKLFWEKYALKGNFTSGTWRELRGKKENLFCRKCGGNHSEQG